MILVYQSIAVQFNPEQQFSSRIFENYFMIVEIELELRERQR